MADKIYLRDLIAKADLVNQIQRNYERNNKNPYLFQQIFKNQQKIEKAFISNIKQSDKIFIEDNFFKNQNKEERNKKQKEKKEGRVDVRV
jgi:hypothetical protein